MGLIRKMMRSNSIDFATRFAQQSARIRSTPLTAKQIKPIMGFDIETGGLDKEPDPALKGVYGGNCNRVACQKPGAGFYNHSTRKYYCGRCADMINAHNHDDSFRLFGHDLCTEGRHAE